jgi:hypothetical protein
MRQSFRDENDRPNLCERREALDQDLVADGVDRINGVAFVVAIDARHLLRGGTTAFRKDAGPQVAVQFADARDEISFSRKIGVRHGRASVFQCGPFAARSSAALVSGAVSFRKEPPPISGPARYFKSPGLRSGGWISMWK